MRLDSGQIAFRTTLCLTLVAWSLVACSGGVAPPNPPSDGPPFVINSPVDGSQISGTVFFSAQPFDAAAVRRVSFRAGDSDLGVDRTADDGFRVFLDSADFAAGELELTATLVGTNGRSTVHSVTVDNVPAPPAQATVTEAGAVLGAAESGGALSILTVPAGAPEGVEVGFEALDQAEVLALTGVDYDELGVTFLGAQGIEADAPLGTALGVTSGGFGPMVQPEQVVVNYSIAPDADGDGVGELMVVNTASITPGGDVISDPQERVLLGEGAISTTRAGSRFHTLQQGLSGPAGTRLSIEVEGLAALSFYGNLALWTSGVDAEMLIVPGVVLPDPADPTLQRFSTVIPPLSAGPAELMIVSGSSGFASDPIDVTVEPSAAPSGEASATIATLFDGLEAYLGGLETPSPEEEARFGDASAQIVALRSDFAELESMDMPPEVAELVAEALDDIAIMIENSGVLQELDDGASLRTQYSSFDDFVDDASNLLAGLASVVGGVAIGIGAIYTSPVVAFLLGIAAGLVVIAGSLYSLYYLCKLLGGGYCFSSPPPPCIIVPGTPPAIWAPGTPPAPEGIVAQQAGPTSTVTGMGSLVPPGGDACGTALGEPNTDPGALRSAAVGGTVETLFGDMTGRFVVKVFYGGGNSVPFSGVSDASGYFYLPTIPAGQPFEAIAYDTLTSETRSFEGVGAEVGDSTYLFFDFASEGASGGTVLDYDSNIEGTHGDVDLYLFEGRAGDLINIAVFSEEENLGGIDYQLSDPDGVPMVTGLTTGGRLFDLGSPVPITLESDGLFAFSLDGSNASGAYTLGLALLSPPQTIDVASPILAELSTLGDRHYYQLTGAVDEVLGVTISHEPTSTLEASMSVLRPDDLLEFYQRPQLFKLVTDEVQRSRSNQRTLEQAGGYVIEVELADLFSETLDAHLGSYQLDITLGVP